MTVERIERGVVEMEEEKVRSRQAGGSFLKIKWCHYEPPAVRDSYPICPFFSFLQRRNSLLEEKESYVISFVEVIRASQ